MDVRRQSIYFPEEMLADLRHEARRLDRSLSWAVQQCCQRGGIEHLQALPSDAEGVAA